MWLSLPPSPFLSFSPSLPLFLSLSLPPARCCLSKVNPRRQADSQSHASALVTWDACPCQLNQQRTDQLAWQRNAGGGLVSSSLWPSLCTPTFLSITTLSLYPKGACILPQPTPTNTYMGPLCEAHWRLHSVSCCRTCWIGVGQHSTVLLVFVGPVWKHLYPLSLFSPTSLLTLFF